MYQILQTLYIDVLRRNRKNHFILFNLAPGVELIPVLMVPGVGAGVDLHEIFRICTSLV